MKDIILKFDSLTMFIVSVNYIFIISVDSEKLSNLVIKKDKIIQTGFLKFDSNISGDTS